MDCHWGGCSMSLYNLFPLQHSAWYFMCGIKNIPIQKKTPCVIFWAGRLKSSVMPTRFVKVKEKVSLSCSETWAEFAWENTGYDTVSRSSEEPSDKHPQREWHNSLNCLAPWTSSRRQSQNINYVFFGSVFLRLWHLGPCCLGGSTSPRVR